MISDIASHAMLVAVLACFAAACAAPPLLTRLGTVLGGRLLALLPLILLGVLLSGFGAEVAAGGAVVQSLAWIPGLSVSASFLFDGLSMLMAVLVLGIGVLILTFAASYLDGDDRAPRFFAYLMSFMGAMLGLVLSDNLLLLFVFWELTSVTSFLLIGYDHEDEKARKSAFQGLFVTVAGGLVMLAGIIVLAEMAGSYELSAILAGEDLHAAPGAGLALALIAIGCFTKSAQFPFHFWLPNAMAAPTPVSAYLHSATMVKAGVYLLARLHPVLGEHAHWFWWLVPAGSVTMLLGAVLAFRSSGLKRVLAYTTVMALGTLTLLLGLGEAGAAVSFLLAHALYKGALFLVAGIVTHESGAKDIRDANGLARHMPVTAVAALIAAASAAGLPPLFGFIGKELLMEAGQHGPVLVRVMALLAGALVAAMVATLVLRVFFSGDGRANPKAAHEAPWSMLAGPVVLGIGTVLFGLFPGLATDSMLAAAAKAAGEEGKFYLALWHGFNMALLMSTVSLLIAVGLFLGWPAMQRRFAAWTVPERFGAEAGYGRLLDGILGIASLQTRLLQSGYLRYYVMTLLLVLLTLTGGTLLARTGIIVPAGADFGSYGVPAVMAAIILAAGMAALRTRTALKAVLALGALGFGVALVFLWYSAPDLAITQVMIETLTTILLVLVLFRMPRFRRLSTVAERARDVVIAVSVGALMTALVWMVIGGRQFPSIASWFLEHSVAEGYGRNVVNVILVDFRALDTLGEIFVLALAAVGVYALLRGPAMLESERSKP
ncbi:hydrogen gas-evolving membrane-bound hydrogenase subunit E [Algiphilus sp.]|uniref:hydrogen gas-evolving membrane-bound hydrogenase subunit E n=1 Tax=Algiphilus sp. TaxID=1872431 RepID=UPI0032EFD840